VWQAFERSLPIVLQGHSHHGDTTKWHSGDNPKKLLASGVFDYTVRLWDVTNQTRVCLLQRNSQPIYTIGFSPGGNFFVSGGIDNVMNA
jgi:WD40 repeat protein